VRRTVDHRGARTHDQSVPRWIVAVVALGATLLLVGALLAILRPSMLLAHGEPITSGVRVYSGYLFSRNLALGILLLAALAPAFRSNLPGMIALYTLIQALDAIVDCFEGRWSVLPPVVLLGLLFGWAWWRLRQQPAWIAAAPR
jgi:hypothetical protein